MELLLYCIFPGDGIAVPPSLTGVGGRPLITVGGANLRAAVSPCRRDDLHPDRQTWQTYGRIIEWYHNHYTAIPLRFGYLLPDASQVERLLTERRTYFKTLLEGLQGCVEMGIRIFLPRGALGGSAREDSAASTASGLGYLNARRRDFAREDREGREADLLAEKVCLALTGHYRRHLRESRGLPQGRLLSLYFLVPTAAQVAFREATRGLSAPGTSQVLLSGPWPPYNFVLATPPLQKPTAAMEAQ
ncbi:MAG: GvpL/GvpF family gas vesicle protein [Desulfobaccales bacterium]